MQHLDPDYLPLTTGTLHRFVFNPDADVDGLLFTDGTEIHTSPHLSVPLQKALAPGDSLTVRGVKSRDTHLIIAVAIEPANGERIVDDGPGHSHKKPDKPAHSPKKHVEPVTHDGIIQQLLHGPKGQVHGALLLDGTVVRFPPHSAASYVDLLVLTEPLSVRGNAMKVGLSTVIDAHAMGRDSATLIDVGPKPPKPDGKPPHKKPPHDKKPHAKHATAATPDVPKPGALKPGKPHPPKPSLHH